MVLCMPVCVGSDCFSSACDIIALCGILAEELNYEIVDNVGDEGKQFKKKVFNCRESREKAFGETKTEEKLCLRQGRDHMILKDIR